MQSRLMMAGKQNLNFSLPSIIPRHLLWRANDFRGYLFKNHRREFKITAHLSLPCFQMAICTHLVSDLMFGHWGTYSNILLGPSFYVTAVVWPWCPVKFYSCFEETSHLELPHNWDPLDSLGWHPAHHIHRWPKIILKSNESGPDILASLLTTGLRL